MFRVIAIATALVGIAVAQDEIVPRRADKPSASERAAGTSARQGEDKGVSADELTRQVRRLVRQLDSAEIATRDQAYSELVRIGASALEHLPEVTDATPASVRDALKRLRGDFDKQDADRAMQATQASIAGKGLSLKKVVEDLAQQTGNQVALNDETLETTVDLELSKSPFWQSLDKIADQAKLGVYLYGGDGVALVPLPPGQFARTQNAVYNGPIRFEPARVELKRDARLDESATLTVGVSIAWEPRLQPITLVQRKAALKAIDENGIPIAVSDQGDIPAMINLGSPAVEIELGFEAPPRTVKQIASLQGAVDLLIPGKSEVFEFENLKKAQKVVQQRHNVTVTLDGIRKTGEVWELRLRIKYAQALDAFDSHLAGWILSNEAVMVTASGETIDNAGLDTTHRLDDEIGVAYLFDLEQGLDGLKFRYRTPVSIHQIPVEYEFKNIALP